MSETELLPSGAPGTRAAGEATGHHATGVTAPLSIADLPGGTGPGAGDGPAGPGRAATPYPGRRSLRTHRRMMELSRRGIPWWWVAGALIALLLVGRGVIGAASGGSGPGTAAPPVVSVTTVPFPQASTPADVVPTTNRSTPPELQRVTLPQVSPRPVGSSTPSASPVPRNSAHPVAACAVAVATATFYGGYVAGVTVTNSGGTTVRGWQLTFRLPQGQRLTNGWNGRFSVSGGTVTAQDAGSNATLAPGASTQLGFQAQVMDGGGPGGPGGPGGQGSFPGPFGFALNGVTCSR